MASATKIVKKTNAPSPAQTAVSQAIAEVEANHAGLKVGSGLRVTAAKEVEVPGSKTAVVVFVPFRQHSELRKVQAQLVVELENKLGKQVVFLAQRRILQKAPATGNTKKLQKRPRSRTLTAVHDAILDDLVFPAEVSGKRTRVKVDGSKTIKVTLEGRESAEHKLDLYSAVYKKLTTKDVSFSFDKTHLAPVEAN